MKNFGVSNVPPM